MGRLATCRDCGASISKKAVTCPQCGRPLRKPAKQYGCCSGFLIMGLVGVIVLIGASIFSGRRDRPAVNPVPQSPSPSVPSSNPAPQAPSSSAPSTRDDVWTRLDTGYISDQSLTYRGTPVVCLCVDDKAWDEMLDAQNKGDLEEIAMLVAKEKVALVPRGTRVKCVETAFASIKLRVLEGLSTGLEGWLQKELVSKGEAPAEHSIQGAPSSEREVDTRPPAKKRQPTPRSQPLDAEQLARARFQTGRNLEKGGRDELAVTAYRKIVKDFPDTPQAKQAEERIKALTGK